MSEQLPQVQETTIALIEQFKIALSVNGQDAVNSISNAPQRTEKDALPLLSASATALRAQATKLSLLAITSPFTESAVTDVLTSLNESVLPSLVTTSLLITSSAYTKEFQAEVRILSKNVLKELAALVEEVNKIGGIDSAAADNDKKIANKTGSDAGSERPVHAENDVVTALTGRVWDACDSLVDVAGKGVVGLVIRRVEEWRDLVRDAIAEIEEWDPLEEEDAFFDDSLADNRKSETLLGSKGEGIRINREDIGDDLGLDDENSEEKASFDALASKNSTIRFLKPIVQIYPAIVSNRLKRTGHLALSSSSGISKLEVLMKSLRMVSDQVDEAAGALYEANVASLIQHLMNAKGYAAEALRVVTLPWSVGNGSENEDHSATKDKFTLWAKTWLKVMEEVSSSIVGSMGEKY